MALASLGAYFIGEYPEAVTILLAYAVGEILEDNASGKARDRIRALLSNSSATP